MWEHRIKSLEARDLRFPREHGTGSDSVHSGAEYVFAATLLHQRTGNIAGAQKELRMVLQLTPGDSEAENVSAALEHMQDHAN